MTQSWLSILISWLPFLLLLVFWVWFMGRRGFAGKQQQYMQRSLELLEQQQLLLQRIAAALEERNKRS